MVATIETGSQPYNILQGSSKPSTPLPACLRIITHRDLDTTTGICRHFTPPRKEEELSGSLGQEAFHLGL